MSATGTNKLRSALWILVGGHVVAGGIATVVGNETWYKKCIMPCSRLVGAERAHWLAVKAAKYKLVPVMKKEELPALTTEVWGKKFENPIGLAAGFDKHGEAVNGLLKMGFGFVEVGSVTPLPQEGNPTPRMFRLSEDKAVINRYGFNSEGHEVVYKRLKDRVENVTGPEAPDDRNMLNEQFWSPDRPTFQGTYHPEAGVVGVNLGKNKTSEDAAEDYVKGVAKFGAISDYLVINVSSPNTPNLRDLQGRKHLQDLIFKVVEERNKLPDDKRPPVLIKIAPDLTWQNKLDIAAVVGKQQSGVDGLIITNTTVTRPDSLRSSNKNETGGLSGAPLKSLSTQTVRDMYRLTHGRLPIIGVGGVASGEDAYEKIKAGASLVQLYTALGYDGPPLVPKVKRELAELLQQDGYQLVSEAVGADFKTAEGS